MTYRHRLLALALALLAGAAFAQEEDDPSIEIDSDPTGSDEPEKREDARPAPPAGAAPARAKGAKPKWVEIRDKSGRFTMKVPDDWRIHPEERDPFAFHCDVKLPGSRLNARLLLEPLESLGDPRRGPHGFRANAVKQVQAKTNAAGYDPLPHLVMTYDVQNEPFATTWVFLSFMDHGYLLRIQCPEADHAQAHADLLAAAESLEAKLEPANPVPQNYATSSKGPFLLAVHPSVVSPTDHVLKIAAKQVKAFRKVHGRLPKRDLPAAIYVHNDKFQAKPILAEVADSKGDTYVDHVGARLFAKPVPKGNVEQEALFVADVWALLFSMRYGDRQPLWVMTGERLVARAEYQTGRRLPSLYAGFSGWRNQDLVPLDQLAPENWEPFYKSAFFYVAALRAGPSKYRKLYKAFLADLARTPDPEAALEKHFKPLAPGKFKQDVRDWIWAKIKEVRPN